jgi:hypothetical protein
MKTALCLVFACTTLLSQTADNLRQKYGMPVSESYLVRQTIDRGLAASDAGRTEPVEAVRERFNLPK